MTNKSIEKYYRYAEYIAGKNGKDLLHHVYLELPDNIRHEDAYIWKCLVHAYYGKNSTYNKLYNSLGVTLIEDIDQHLEDVNYQHQNTKIYKTYNALATESIEDVEQKTEDSYLYDSQLLHKILLQLEIEGYATEVRVYKDCIFNSSIYVLSKKSKVNRRTITKICKFIENEIRIRYERLDNI